MTDRPSTLPKNTPKKTGRGCAPFALLLPIGVAAVVLGLKLGVEGQIYQIVGSFGIAIGSLAAVLGIGMLRQGRRVDKLMAGQGLIARWDYKTEKGEDGFVFIGEDGVFHNAAYTEWSRSFVLEGVEIVEGEPTELIFRILILRRNSSASSSAATTKKLRIPIPPGKEVDAQKVIEHFGSSD